MRYAKVVSEHITRALELLLSSTEQIALAPNEAIDIPIAFAAEQPIKREACLYVDIRKMSGQAWRQNRDGRQNTDKLI